MKTKSIFSALAVVLIIFFLVSCKEDGTKDTDQQTLTTTTTTQAIEDTDCGICNLRDRFANVSGERGGGKRLNEDQARAAITKFHERFPEEKIGVFLSAKALVEIFRDLNHNGLMVYMGFDEEGQAKLYFQGASNRETELDLEMEGEWFVSESLCPDVCGSVKFDSAE